MPAEAAHIIWTQCQNQLREELPEQQYNSWIRPLKTGDSSGADKSWDELCLFAPNRFIEDWVKNKFSDRIQELCMQYGGETVSLRVTSSVIQKQYINRSSETFDDIKIAADQNVNAKSVKKYRLKN